MFILISFVFLHQEWVQKSWDDYYSKTISIKYNFENKNFTSEDSHLTPTDNTYVFNCYFYELSEYDGGAILYSVSNCYLLVEKCSFYKCRANHYTPGIRVIGG